MTSLAERVVRRYLVAAKVTLDLAWVEKLRKDFLTLLKNLPKVKDYKTAIELKQAFNVYRNHFEELFFEQFLNHDLKYTHPNISESDAKWFDKQLRGPAWGFSTELRVPIQESDDFWKEESRFFQYEKGAATWKARVQRRAQIFWKEMKDFLEYYGRVHGKPEIDVEVPTVENATVEGFKLVMKGFKPGDAWNEKELEIFKEGLRLYKKRAAAVAPILLRRQLPVVVEFKTTLDKGGEYNHGGYITFYASSILSKGVGWVAHVMAHEMGHHLFRSYLSDEATNFWMMTIRGDYGDIDLKELLDKWPGDTWAFDFPKVLGDTDPILALQVDAASSDRLQSKEDFQKLYDSGERKLHVPKHPITGYANKNTEEAFCETLGLLVAYGPAAVHEKVRWWLNTAMPGDVRVASVRKACEGGCDGSCGGECQCSTYDRRTAANPLLKEPGDHEFEVKVGPYEVTVRLSIPEASEHKIPSARVYVQEDVWREEAFLEDYEDALLIAVGKKLGVRTSWSEGDWGRGGAGMKSRGVGIR